MRNPLRLTSLVVLIAAGGVLAGSADAAAQPLATGTSQRPAGTASLLERVAVFGKDDRKAVPDQMGKTAAALGLLFNNGARTVCSAFCVAPDIVATAAHCVFGATGTKAPDIEKFVFLRHGATARRPVPIAGTEDGHAAFNVIAGSSRLSTRPPIDATSDWALLRLESAACEDNLLRVTPATPADVTSAARAGKLFQLAYHRDFKPWRLAYSSPCGTVPEHPAASRERIGKDFLQSQHLVLHGCDTGGASSGSPLLMEGTDGPTVVAINVGTYVLTKVRVLKGEVVKREGSTAIANTAVASSAFVDRIALLASSEVVMEPTRLRVMQAHLKQRKHYSGPLDGRYGDRLRRAIQQFESAQGLAVTGLPTLALLRRLETSGRIAGSAN